MSGRRTFQKGAWARNKTRLLGKELLNVVNEGTASTLPGRGEGSIPKQPLASLGRTEADDESQSCQTSRAAPPSRCPGGVTRTIGRNGLPGGKFCSTCRALHDQETLGHHQGDLASWMSLRSLEMKANHDDGNKTSTGSQPTKRMVGKTGGENGKSELSL